MPVVTFTTDFGEGSPYVAAMKARVLEACAAATLIDVSHAVPPFDIRAASFVLWSGTRDFARQDAVHLAVIDPGVGGERRGIACEVASGARYVGPDNGTFTLVLQQDRLVAAVELSVPPSAAPTFHGRDVFAPAAGRLAAGAPLASLGPPLTELTRLPDPGPAIAWVDPYGNQVTTLTSMPAGLRINGRSVHDRSRTFAEAPRDKPFLYAGSLGYVEIGVREGRADRMLGAAAGMRVEILA